MRKVVPIVEGSRTEAVEAVAPNPLSGDPVTHVWRSFVHPQGTVSAGVWECAAGSFAIPSHPSCEMCTILEGEAVIEHGDGSRLTVRPGDCFVIPQGTHTIWHIPHHVKKTFICCVVPE